MPDHWLNQLQQDPTYEVEQAYNPGIDLTIYRCKFDVGNNKKSM